MTSKFKSKQTSLPGMRPFPREMPVPIEEMKADDLRTLYRKNEDVLRTLAASSSSFVERLEANQAKIKARLTEIEGIENIQHRMRRATISEDDQMAVDKPEVLVSRTFLVKQQAVAAWGKASQNRSKHKTGTMSLEDAIAIEQRQIAVEQERRARVLERREMLTMPSPLHGLETIMSRKEYEAKVWAFMNYKPTDSDLEGEDDDDDDPSTWFEDDQDDGVKGQDIVYPDPEDLTDIIRLDESKFHYDTF
ncbi:hypothetical protein EW145_g144 [Phellinidium pouzarii]|uniref:Uncharacterized protein n=1 Tax=Phellinidium pouzarii TaxID=167371 RepID=A0A4S4LJQ2_9AGAM|nr:hypothetical protein EW145_g144 [Phellinidium pouzarii]